MDYTPSGAPGRLVGNTPMHALSEFFPDLLVVAALLLAAMALAPVAQRLRLPGPAAFLFVGVVAGAVDVVPTGNIGALPLEEIGVVALYGILLQGGLATGFTAWRRETRSIVALGLPGTALTAAALAVFGHYVLGLSWALASLVAVALSPTDPAAVYATLRGGGASARSRTILEGESGFNDPVGISLMVVVVSFLSSDDATVGEGVVRFVEELGIGIAGGVVGAALVVLLLRATPRLEEGLQSVAVLVMAVIVGAGTASVHGSGFLAVYVCGLLVADRWAEQDGTHHAIPEAVAAGAEPLLFGLLGAVFASTVTGVDLLYGVALTAATVLVVRPAVALICLRGARLRPDEVGLISIGGLKGAVPLLLAAYPALESLDEARSTEAIVLCATALSILVQGLAPSLYASRSSTATVAPRVA
jgi:cell volume regulation protein A